MWRLEKGGDGIETAVEKAVEMVKVGFEPPLALLIPPSLLASLVLLALLAPLGLLDLGDSELSSRSLFLLDGGLLSALLIGDSVLFCDDVLTDLPTGDNDSGF